MQARKAAAMQHRVSYRIYYEDTDCLGVVYYANYFKFAERGRTEMLAAHGRGVADWNRDGVLIVVHSVKAKFRKPAALGDTIDVVSTFTVDSRFRGTFHQRIERDGELLVTADVEVVCVSHDQQLIELPKDLAALVTPLA